MEGFQVLNHGEIIFHPDSGSQLDRNFKAGKG